MKLFLTIIFFIHSLMIFGQYKFDIIDDLEPELVEKWTIDFIQKKRIENVSVKIKADNNRLIKSRRRFDLLKYDSLTNTIRYKEISVFPTLDKGGYSISYFKDISLNYDSQNLLVSKTEQSSEKMNADGYWQPEKTSQTYFEYNSEKLNREITITTELKSTKQISNQYLDSSYIVVENKSIYDYEYNLDSNLIYYSNTPDTVVYGKPSDINIKLLSTSSCKKRIFKIQHLNQEGLIEMEIIYKFGRIDTLKYCYKNEVLVSKTHLTNMKTEINYYDKGNIESRCMSLNDEDCSYFNYTYDNNKELREEKNGNSVILSKIKYNSDGLIIKKIVRYNGHVIIKYRYCYN